MKMANFEGLSKGIFAHYLPWIFSLLILMARIDGGCAIFYGRIAEGTEYSYTVAIAAHRPCGKCSFCSGAIISAQHILTAAHCGYCIDDVKRYNVFVRDVNSEYGVRSLRIKEVHRHPDYVHGVSALQFCIEMLAGCFLNRPADMKPINDIAVIKLQTALTLGGSLSRMKLPLPCPLRHLKICTFSGFGANEDGRSMIQGGYFIPSLRWTPISIIDRAECQKQNYHLLMANITCIQDLPNQKIYLAGGDSGGPLVCDNAVYGVYSTGPSNGNIAGIATDVSYYLEFIFRILRSG